MLSSIEICAGAGGQALGLELAGFDHAALIEIDSPACKTLELNRPEWNIIEDDIHNFDGRVCKGIDLFSGGVPCPPFSKAGKQLGSHDERDLFPEALRLIGEIKPRAIMLENVRGLLDPKFDSYRHSIEDTLRKLGYIGQWKLFHANDYGVPQLRPRVIFVALKKDLYAHFRWPTSSNKPPLTVGETLFDLMAYRGWRQAPQWKILANSIAPTLVGGSKRHGGPDLGPTRAKKAWAALSIDGHGIADEEPEVDFIGMPRLTVRMAARIQGFPDSWQFFGRKTPAYRQIGNAFPPPVAQAIGSSIHNALRHSERIYFHVSEHLELTA